MTELWWFAAAFLIVYLGLGAVAAPGIAAKIERARRRSPGAGGGGGLASFLTTTVSGRLTVVLLWPVLAWAAHWGFLFGRWDWRAETSHTERR